MADGNGNKIKIYLWVITVLTTLTFSAYGFIGNSIAEEIKTKKDADVADAEHAALLQEVKHLREVQDVKLDTILKELKRLDEDR